MLSRKRVNTFDDSGQLRKKRKRDSQDAPTFKSVNSDETESQLHLYLEVSDEETDHCSKIGSSDLRCCRDISNSVREKNNLITESASNVTSDVLYVFVDTETTGINHEKDEILQIAATSNKSLEPCFNQYILPSCKIGKDVTQLNGLRMHRGRLQWNSKAVCAEYCGTVLDNFLAYLDDLKRLFRINSLVIVAHLASFDMSFLCVQFFKHGLWGRFKEMVCGVVDTLDIFQKVYEDNQNYKLTHLAKVYANEDITGISHNAYHHAWMLRNLSGMVHEYFPEFTIGIADYERKHLLGIIQNVHDH